MSQESGASLVFGLLLYPELGPKMAEFLTSFWKWVSDSADEHAVTVDEYCREADLGEWEKAAVAAARACGVDVPEAAGLFWTGTWDERPARCQTPAESFVLGFGGFTFPWRWEVDFQVSKWSASFKEKAQFWDWTWIG